MTSLLLTLLPVVILIANYYLLQYNFFPLTISIIAINLVLYYNFIVFWIQLYYRNKNYHMRNQYFVSGIIGSIFLLLSYCAIIRTDFLVKPFSDYFGYLIIRKDLNKKLNEDKKEKPGILLSVLISIFKVILKIVSFINTIITYFVTLVKKDYISPVTIAINNLNQKIKEYQVESKEYLDKVNNYDFNWDILINSIHFMPDGIHKSKSKKKKNYNMVEKIVSKFLDMPVNKNNETLDEIFSRIPELSRIEKEDIIKLLDRKFLISKIIWLLLIIIITHGYYMALVS